MLHHCFPDEVSELPVRDFDPNLLDGRFPCRVEVAKLFQLLELSEYEYFECELCYYFVSVL